MVTAEASVATDRPGRYLTQLCRHLSLAAQRNPQMTVRVEWSDDQGLITLGRGRCLLRAAPGVLTLRAEAADEETLHHLQRRIADRLERIGGREDLAVTWVPATTPGTRSYDTKGELHG